MKRVLYKYQKEAMKYCLKNRHPALFMEMRLGKSLVSIRYLKLLNCKKVLIICPLASLPTWEEELALENIIPDKIRPNHSWRDPGIISENWNLVNFEGLKINNHLFNEEYDAVIVDESTRIKNPKSNISKIISLNFRNSLHRMILTGLPNPESALNFFQQFKFLKNGMMGYSNYWRWRQAHFENIGFDWIAKFKSKKEIKKWVSDNSFILSRKDAGIKDRKTYLKRYCLMGDTHKKLYMDALLNFSIGDVETKTRVEQYSWLYQLCGGIDPRNKTPIPGAIDKCKEVYYLLKNELWNEKVVIFCRHLAEIKFLSSYLNGKGFNHEVINGGISIDKRKRIIDRFKYNDDHLICQTECGRYTLNLSSSNTIIFYSNPLSGETRQQCEDRVIHTEKKINDILIIDLAYRNTIDEDIISAHKNKKIESGYFIRNLLEKLKRKILQGK